MATSLHRTGMLLLATLGSALLALVILASTRMLTIFDTSAAAYLPEKSTLAVLHHPSAEDLDAWAAWFPELRELPSTEHTDTIALVVREGGERIPLLFFKTGRPRAGKKYPIVAGAYRVTSPDGETAEWAVSQTGATLSNSKAYAALSSGRRRESSWTFLRKTTIPRPPSRQLLQELLLQGSEALAVERETNGTRTIMLFGERGTPGNGVTPLPHTQTGDILHVRLQGGWDVWQSFQRSISDEEQMMLTGTLQQLLRKGFGDTVSLQYAVLPILRSDLEFSLQRTRSGTLLFSLRALARDGQDFDRLTEGLHEGTKWRLPTTSIAAYSFDDRFSTRTIRSDATLFTEEWYAEGDWRVHRTQAREAETGLFTAVRGDELVLTNAEALLSQLLRDETAELPKKEEPSASRQAQGWFDASLLQPLLQKHLPMLAGDMQWPILKDLPPLVLWSMEREGMITTIRLRPG